MSYDWRLTGRIIPLICCCMAQVNYSIHSFSFRKIKEKKTEESRQAYLVAPSWELTYFLYLSLCWFNSFCHVSSSSSPPLPTSFKLYSTGVDI